MGAFSVIGEKNSFIESAWFSAWQLHIIIEEEFIRMRTQAQRIMLLAFVIVSFLGPGLGNGTGQGEGWHRAKRINKGRGRIGHGQHVASFNALPTPDG